MDDLKHLLGAYFYELWDEHEYDSWHAAVDDFVRRSPDAPPESRDRSTSCWLPSARTICFLASCRTWVARTTLPRATGAGSWPSATAS